MSIRPRYAAWVRNVGDARVSTRVFGLIFLAKSALTFGTSLASIADIMLSYALEFVAANIDAEKDRSKKNKVVFIALLSAPLFCAP